VARDVYTSRNSEQEIAYVGAAYVQRATDSVPPLRVSPAGHKFIRTWGHITNDKTAIFVLEVVEFRARIGQPLMTRLKRYGVPYVGIRCRNTVDHPSTDGDEMGRAQHEIDRTNFVTWIDGNGLCFGRIGRVGVIGREIPGIEPLPFFPRNEPVVILNPIIHSEKVPAWGQVEDAKLTQIICGVTFIAGPLLCSGVPGSTVGDYLCVGKGLAIFVEDMAGDGTRAGEFEDKIGHALAGNEREDGSLSSRPLLAVFGIDETVAGNSQVVRTGRDAIEEKMTLVVGEKEIGKVTSVVSLKADLGLLEGFASIQTENVAADGGFFFLNVSTS
jgi:hypothetical protein